MSGRKGLWWSLLLPDTEWQELLLLLLDEDAVNLHQTQHQTNQFRGNREQAHLLEEEENLLLPEGSSLIGVSWLGLTSGAVPL